MERVKKLNRYQKFILLVLALMGIWRAAKGSAEPLPLIGKIKI